MKQEDIDRMVTGSPILDERYAIEVAFRNYERSIAAPLKSVLDREWSEDENLYAVAQIAANAITYRNRTISKLEKDIADLKSRLEYAVLHMPTTTTTYGGYTQEQFKAILDSNRLMTERLQWLFNEPDGEKLSYWQRLVVREALGLSNYCPEPPSMFGPAPEKWVVEVWQNGCAKWERSQNEDTRGEFSSESLALAEIAANEKRHPGENMNRRARRIA
jgi:hypothetical protein